MERRYDAIDLVKFLASIFVVSIHASALFDISPTLNTWICEGIARLAVPIFFTVSAFFMFSKPVNVDTIRKYCIRMGKLYICWFVISFPLTIFNRIISSSYSIPVTLFRFFRSFFFTSTFSGSWFLVSCMFCAIIYEKLERMQENKRRTVTIVISATAYSLCVFTSTYGTLIDTLGLSKAYTVWEMLLAKPYTSILVGIPYFALGRYFAQKQYNGHPVTVNRIGIICAIVLFIAEVVVVDHYHLSHATDCYFMLFSCIFYLFPFFLSINVQIPCAKKLRVASTVIFFSQFIWLFCLDFVEWVFKITIPCLAKFGITVMLGLILTQFLLVLSKKYKVFRYFY